jgi:hypothetical protein
VTSRGGPEQYDFLGTCFFVIQLFRSTAARRVNYSYYFLLFIILRIADITFFVLLKIYGEFVADEVISS